MAVSCTAKLPLNALHGPESASRSFYFGKCLQRSLLRGVESNDSSRQLARVGMNFRESVGQSQLLQAGRLHRPCSASNIPSNRPGDFAVTASSSRSVLVRRSSFSKCKGRRRHHKVMPVPAKGVIAAQIERFRRAAPCKREDRHASSFPGQLCCDPLVGCISRRYPAFLQGASKIGRLLVVGPGLPYRH